ncbi:MAG TPA: tripartite tricarboxylate transporter substrate binding protein [Thermodesulfobacteriota bacterium]
MIRTVVLLVALLAPGLVRAAEPYPSKPIEFVTQSSVGGGGDVMARQIIEATKDLIPQPMVVVNKPGAGGRNLENYVKDKKPDGHTLVVTTATSILWYYTGALTYSVNRDLEPIIRLQVEPNLVAVKGDSKWKTMEDLIADAKAGKVTFGGGPIGGPEHLFFHKLARDHGFRLNYVAYGGGGEAGTSLLGGNIDATFLQASESLDHVRSGGIRYLAVASAKRVADIPELKDVPTLREQGVDFVFEHWRGIHAPAGVPAEVVEYLHARFKQGSERESWKKWLTDTAQLGGYLNPSDFKAFTLEQDRLIEQITTDAGLNKKKK